MTSEEPQAEPAEASAEPAEARAEPAGGRGDQQADRGRLDLTDPRAMRALAHPVRWALLEALGRAGTLTATQASEILGESPANCAFHLRTLAKYGFVEEAGGGRGRERPWRQSFESLSWRSLHDDPQTAQAAEALDQVWFDRALTRAQRSLLSKRSWPEPLGKTLGASTSRMYLTIEEAAELYTEIEKMFDKLTYSGSRYAERKDPRLRPPDAVPVEFVLLGYPVFDLPPLPGDEETDQES
jgi:Helix-turn-helix domain